MSRGLSSVVAVVLLVGIALVSSALVGAVLVGVAGPAGGAAAPPTVDLSLSVDAGTDRIVLTHEGGDELEVAALRLRIHVDGEALAEQPPVPFFAAPGFVSGPEGPFNSGGDTTWRTGETAALRLAATNSPTLEPGDRVSVTVATDRWTVAELSTGVG